MQKAIAFFVFFWFVIPLFSQQENLNYQNDGNPGIGEIRDINVSLEGEKPHISTYKILSHSRDTTIVDTSLVIAKDYRFNYLRKDTYSLMPFANVGQTYNTLAYDFNEVRLKPRFGARARHFNYMEVEDISYYHVPTPLTELYFKTAFEQGQQLDAFFTINTTERFNFSVAYKGIRSLGNYQNSLTSTGNFRFTTNYQTKNNRYNLRAHMVFQDLMNQENGGVKRSFIPYFLTNDSEFTDRGRLEVNFQNAENILKGKRFYLDHQYVFIQDHDSISYTELTLGNRVHFEDKFYRFDQKAPFSGYGPSYASADLRDYVSLEEFNTRVYVNFKNHLLGNMHVFVGYTNYNYGYNSALILDSGRIDNRLTGKIIDAGASYQKTYKGFELFGKAAVNVSGEFTGNYILGEASYALDEENKAKASIHLNSHAPDYNFLLYQSDYVNYNWQTNFNNVNTQHLQFDLVSKRLANASISYTGINNYTYFAHTADSITAPFQYNDRVNYLKIEVNKELHYGKFSWDNTFTYQNIMNGEEVFKAPDFLGRSTLYFSDHFFKKALFLQAGISGKYFTKYKMNGYDPVLAEFYVQNHEDFGGFPMLDLFLNAKISQTRIYVKWEHFNAMFGEKNYFSAPLHPYRDWKIRFGLVWNFFM